MPHMGHVKHCNSSVFCGRKSCLSSRRWSTFKTDASGVVFCLSTVHFAVCWAARCPEWYCWSCALLCRTNCFSSGIDGKHWTFCSWAGWWCGLHWSWTAASVCLLSQCPDLKGPAQGRMWCSTGSDKNSFRLIFLPRYTWGLAIPSSATRLCGTNVSCFSVLKQTCSSPWRGEAT